MLPLYATDLGATSGGGVTCVTYASITFGAMLTGWLAKRIPYQALLAGAGLLGIPALVLMGHVTAMWQLIALTGIVWITGGIGLSLVSVLTGVITDPERRGKSFGLMSLSLPLAALAGGMTVGQLIAWQGYATMFAALGALWVVLPLSAWRLAPVSLKPARKDPARTTMTQPGLGGAFYAFTLVTLLSTAAINVGRMGTSLSMHALNFSPSEVASTATVSGLVAIPVVIWIGSLSDRLDRRRLMVLSYVLIAAGVSTLIVATQLWHFWLSATLLVARCQRLGWRGAGDRHAGSGDLRGLSLLNTSGWAAGVSHATSGFITGGHVPVYVGAGLLAALSAFMSKGEGPPPASAGRLRRPQTDHADPTAGLRRGRPHLPLSSRGGRAWRYAYARRPIETLVTSADSPVALVFRVWPGDGATTATLVLRP